MDIIQTRPVLKKIKKKKNLNLSHCRSQSLSTCPQSSPSLSLSVLSSLHLSSPSLSLLVLSSLRLSSSSLSVSVSVSPYRFGRERQLL